MAGLNRESPDVFLPYVTIFPNAPEEALENFDCQGARPTAGEIGGRREKLCVIHPQPDAPFYLISVHVRERRIERITFYSRYGQINQLTQLWGAPESIRRGRFQDAYRLRWDRGGYTAWLVIEEATDLSAARIVTFVQK